MGRNSYAPGGKQNNRKKQFSQKNREASPSLSPQSEQSFILCPGNDCCLRHNPFHTPSLLTKLTVYAIIYKEKSLGFSRRLRYVSVFGKALCHLKSSLLKSSNCPIFVPLSDLCGRGYKFVGEWFFARTVFSFNLSSDCAPTFRNTYNILINKAAIRRSF